MATSCVIGVPIGQYLRALPAVSRLVLRGECSNCTSCFQMTVATSFVNYVPIGQSLRVLYSCSVVPALSRLPVPDVHSNFTSGAESTLATNCEIGSQTGQYLRTLFFCSALGFPTVAHLPLRGLCLNFTSCV